MTVRASPLYFKSGEESLFGWLHEPPAALRSEVGLVICKPFGYEAVCAHASLRAFADACAAAGVAVLRFDYSGTGDSSGGESRAEQSELWCGDIRAAIDTLRRRCHVRRVVLLGVRLGALLAARVAAQESSRAAGGAAAAGSVALIAVAPVISGRRYLRELRAYQATAGGFTAAEAPAEAPGGGLDVTGFSLSAATVAALAATDLLAATLPIAASVLILDRSDLPGAKPWADALLGRGADVRYRCLPGFPEMVSTPHAAQIPREMIAATVEWLGRWMQPAAAPPAPQAVPADAASMTLRSEDGVLLSENALFFDELRSLFAIVTMPAAAAAPDAAGGRYGVVMLNGGATSHIGPNRMYVELARRWAARGYVVLRLDLAGLGDSATRPGRSGNEVYPPGALDDIGAAIDYLRRAHGVANITLAGLCAGAYHALRSATAGLPVDTVLLVNPLTFYWKQGSTLNDLQISEVVRNPGVYAERVLAGKAWLRLLRGRVNLWRIAMIFVRRAWLGLDRLLRDAGRLLHVRLPDDLGWDLQSVAARGVRIVFLFARGDGGADLLKVQGGSAVKAIGDRCRIHTIDGADHVFSQRGPRLQLLQLLSSELPR